MIGLPDLAVRRPITTVMILLSIVVLGGIAVGRLPLAYLPELDVPYIHVEIPYPDSNPTQIEREIAKPVEEVLATLSGVKKLSSQSTADGSGVDLEFSWGQDLDVVRMLVSEKMEQIRPTLPPEIGEILIYSFSTTDIPVVEGRISAQGVNLAENYELLEARVLNPIRRVPGVARVDMDGIAPRDIGIDLVLSKIREHDLDVEALIGRLQGASADMILGRVDAGGLRFTVRALGTLDSVEAIAAFPVDDRGLKLSDVAEITYDEPPVAYGRHLDRQYAVALTVYKESTANTVDVVQTVTRLIEEDINRDPLLAGVQLFVWEDQAEQISAGIDGLKNAGALGAAFAVLILYFFLRRLDSTLIVSLSIPFSIIAACGVMYFLGKTLNLLSMMGLMLGVGMLVDNAIVVLESIDRKRGEEPDPRRAALEGTRLVTMAVVASTATSLIVFLPLIVGASTDLTTWLGEVGITISLALACSLFSSLTLIPLMSAHILRSRRAQPAKALEWLEQRYARILAWTLCRRWATAGLLALALVVGFLPFATGWVKADIFSAHVNKRIFLNYEFHDFHYKSDAEKVVNRVEDYLDAHRQEFLIESVYSFYTENRAGTALILARQDLGDDQIKELRSKVREGLPEIPGVRLFFFEDADSGGDSTAFDVKFFGQDSAVLRGLAEEAVRRLETVEGVKDISPSYQTSRSEIQVKIDREKAARVGLTAQDLSGVFRFTLGGMRLQRFNAGEREVETWLSLRIEDRENVEDLRNIPIGASDGRSVLLGDIADFEVVRREQSIERENRKVRSSVGAIYEGQKWDRTRKEIEGLMDSLSMPAGYAWAWNDRILEQDDQNSQMGTNFVLALILVYLVMASLFESLAQPFAILISIMFCLPGAAWFLAVTDTPFNLMSQIGLLILMGVVVNNGIVLLARVNQHRAAGLSREQAFIESGRDRLRPILMTACTTIIGLLPLALGASTVGGLFYYPLARTLVGGMISSSVLTLLALPVVTLGVEAAAGWFRATWIRSGSLAPLGQPSG